MGSTDSFVRVEDYYAGVSWGPRRESSHECAQRAFALLEALERLDPCFRDYWTWSRGRKKVPVPILPNREAAEQIIARSVNRDDVNRKVIEDLGFYTSFIRDLEIVPGYRKKNYQTLFLRFGCGCYAPRMRNSCVMYLPRYPPASERVLRGDLLAQLTRIFVDTLDAEAVLITSDMHRDVVNGPSPWKEELVGWVMYFARERGVVPPLPTPVRIESVGDKGTLIILTPERLTVSNPEHVELGHQVRRLLRNAGLLKNPYRRDG
jgi:Immunity protein 52